MRSFQTELVLHRWLLLGGVQLSGHLSLPPEGWRAGRSIDLRLLQILLSWRINEGFWGDTDLSGVNAAMAGRYSDDEEDRPWTVILYIDTPATDGQFEGLSEIFLGRAGGDIAFTQAIVHVAGVSRADVELDHQDGHQSIRVGQVPSAGVVEAINHEFGVTCGIPGHDKPGRESVSNSSVKDGPLDWTYQGAAAFPPGFPAGVPARVPGRPVSTYVKISAVIPKKRSD